MKHCKHDQKKICFVLPSHWSALCGGSELQIQYLIDYIQKYRSTYNLYYICRYTHHSSNGLKIVRVNTRGRRVPLLLDYPHITMALKSIQPDVVYQRVACAYTGFVARYCSQHGAKMILHIASQHDVMPFHFSLSRKGLVSFVDNQILRYGIRKADMIIAQAAYQDTLLQMHHGRHCTAVIPNFHPPARPATDKKNDIITVVWIANIKQIKQPELFLRLADRFLYRNNVQFVMAGKNFLSGMLNKIRNAKNISYYGKIPHDQVNGLLEKAHILVNTSTYEGFPNTFIQAWLRRVPVVSLNVDPDGILLQHELGFFCSGDFEALVKHVDTLIHNRPLRERMGTKAAGYAQKTHSLNNNASQILRLIEQ